MIFEKNLLWRTVLKFSQGRRQVLVEVRRGAETCDAPCILGRVLDSTIMQARVKLSCSDGPFAIENKTKKGIGSKIKKSSRQNATSLIHYQHMNTCT